jgi:hypothetical protein
VAHGAGLGACYMASIDIDYWVGSFMLFVYFEGRNSSSLIKQMDARQTLEVALR